MSPPGITLVEVIFLVHIFYYLEHLISSCLKLVFSAKEDFFLLPVILLKKKKKKRLSATWTDQLCIPVNSFKMTI